MARCLAVVLLLFSQAEAATVTSTLGNAASGLADGQLTTIFDLIAAHSGQSAPFDQGYGNDLLSDFSQGWTHSYDAITETIVDATITIGIAEHDSAHDGSQLAFFGVEGIEHTAALDGLFETHGGADTEFNIYTLPLDAAVLAGLADGAASFTLTLSGPTESCGLFPPCLITDFNGAHLVFSTLTIQTIPAPAGLWLLAGALAMLFGQRRRSIGRTTAAYLSPESQS